MAKQDPQRLDNFEEALVNEESTGNRDIYLRRILHLELDDSKTNIESGLWERIVYLLSRSAERRCIHLVECTRCIPIRQNLCRGILR